MKKKHSLTRIAASLLLLPILHLAVTGLVYGGFLLDDIVSDHMEWPYFVGEFLYVILVLMAMLIPHITVGTSIVGIILQTNGMRKGENKKTGILVISAFVLYIVLLIAAFIALMWSLISSGGIGS